MNNYDLLLMDKQIENLNKNINLYKIKNNEQKIIIDKLKDKLYQEELIRRSYVNKLQIRSKL